MRETRNGRPGRSIDDGVIDEVAKALMGPRPAAGFGRRVAARLEETADTGHRFGAGAFALVAAAGLLLAVTAGLLRPGQPAPTSSREPRPSEPQVATSAPAAAVSARQGAGPPQGVSGPAVEPPPSGTTSKAARVASRADRLWARRSVPAMERVVVAPVDRPDPLTVEPLVVGRMSVDDLTVEPLGIDALQPASSSNDGVNPER